MRLLAFDIETTGLDPVRDQILQIGAVVFESDRREVVDQFNVYIKHKRYHGSAKALAMNCATLEFCDTKGFGCHHAFEKFKLFLRNNNLLKPIAVGFNVGPFDIAFMRAYDQDLFHHRSIELGTMAMVDLKESKPVGSSQALKEILGRNVAHDAYQDARDAVDLYYAIMGI